MTSELKHEIVTTIITAGDPVDCIRELTRLILSGTFIAEFKANPKRVGGLLACALAAMAMKLAEVLGHDDEMQPVWTDSGNDFIAACDELAEACNCKTQRVSSGPLINSVIALLLQELMKRLPELLDKLLDEWLKKPNEPQPTTS